MIPSQHPRYQMSIWYAWGQQDAGIGADRDALDFALAHARHAIRMDNGEVSFLPSIQDAWKTWLAAS
jgi:hypothetical protein